MQLVKNLGYNDELFSTCTAYDKGVDRYGGPKCSGIVATTVTIDGISEILYVTTDGYLATKNGRRLLCGDDGTPLRAIDVNPEIWDLSDYMTIQPGSDVRWLDPEVPTEQRPKLYQHCVFPNITFKHVGIVHQPEYPGLEPVRQRVLRPVNLPEGEESYDVCVPCNSPWIVPVEQECVNP